MKNSNSRTQTLLLKRRHLQPLVRVTLWLTTAFVLTSPLSSAAAEFDVIRPLLQNKCFKCHGDEDANGEVNLQKITSRREFINQPELLRKVLGAIDGNNMPPEDEPQLSNLERSRLLASLKLMLKESVTTKKPTHVPVRRLNRFQYNYAVKDLFQLKLDVFPLPEKLMTRHSGYLQPGVREMPRQVNVASHSLAPEPGLRGVKAFPKDLRATHGFDNQANELTLSPLLLDAFFRLSVSIIESPDFTAANVGVWSDLFQQPAENIDQKQEIERRLRRFLALAFREAVDQPTIARYTAYAEKKLGQGLSFTESIKKVASAVLSSPRFLLRTTTNDSIGNQFEFAANLSFFLWSSGPDEELLELAQRGDLARPEVLKQSVVRMLNDPKVERFLDSFPVQWMQLENVLAATPDPALNRYFRLDEKRPASLQMLLEPLLLFDTVFVEDKPVAELIKPDFSYRSEFLTAWYTSPLKPQPIDAETIAAENLRNDQQRRKLQQSIQNNQNELTVLGNTVRQRLLATREEDAGKPRQVDLKPYAAWEFNGDLKESVRSLHLESHGDVKFENDMVVLNKSYLLSAKLPINLKAKSLEVWCKLDNLDQRGGGLMGIQGPGDFFDTIVLGERQPRHWISGSNGFSRTEDFPESTPENNTSELLHLVMVYSADGLTTMYRNGKPYGKPFRKGQATFPKDRTSVIFGLRHLPARGNKYLNVKIDKARLYDRALTPDEVAAAASGGDYIRKEELRAAMTPAQRTKSDALMAAIASSQRELKLVPPRRDPATAKQNAQKVFEDNLRRQMQSRTFERMQLADPRYGGVITNAAVLSMTSGPTRTHPIARGAWIIEAILNDPPSPPPNDVPPLNEDAGDKNQTIRERFAAHRNNPSCAGCHSRLDPLGFALENFDIIGRWRDRYRNGRVVDASGTLLRKHKFETVTQFKEALYAEEQRFAKAFTGHLLRFATSRQLSAADTVEIDKIIKTTANDHYKLRSLIQAVVQSSSFANRKKTP